MLRAPCVLHHVLYIILQYITHCSFVIINYIISYYWLYGDDRYCSFVNTNNIVIMKTTRTTIIKYVRLGPYLVAFSAPAIPGQLSTAAAALAAAVVVAEVAAEAADAALSARAAAVAARAGDGADSGAL